jgi:putative membrane protein
MKKLLIVVCTAAITLAIPLSGAASASPKPSGLDEEYLTTSMRGDLFEIDGGKIALARSRNRAVDRLARRLIKDHSKSYDDAARLARRLGVEVPNAPTASEIWELKVISHLRAGHTFNHWYASLESYDHVQDISETTDEVQNGKLRAVRKSAKDELPMLYKHLELSRRTLAAVH